MKEFPLRRVELSDREPEQCGYDKSKWGYWDRGTHPPEDAGDLPRELVIAFGWETDDWTWFKGHNAANDALSAACLLFASS